MVLFDNEFTKRITEKTLSTTFINAITEMYKEFCFQVMVDLTTFRYDPKTYSAFVDLKLVSKEYALQKYFEPRLDTYIRDYLVYGVVEAVLEDHDIDVYKPALPDEYCEINKFYSTSEYEKIVGFEFVTINEVFKKTGYRFTSIPDYKAEEYFNTGLYDEIIVINWDNSYVINNEENKKKYVGAKRNQVCEVSASDAFTMLFGLEESEAFLFFLHHVIDRFHDTLGITSIPKLTAPMLFQHRIEEERILKDKLTEAQLGYQIIKNENALKYPRLESDSKRLIKMAGLLKEFIDRKLFKALVGKSDFAKSFLTSEYLYNQFNNNDMFDYTAVVSGYLKSVEQLMFRLVLQYTDQRDNKGRLYRVGPSNNKTTLTTDHVKANKISATMGNLIYFFKNDYPETVKISDSGLKDSFFTCLELYLDECRNQSFHKHNNYDWGKVEKIRNNTMILYMLLLGACSSEDDIKNISHFEIVEDDRLERIYYWLRRKEMYTFKVKMPGESKYLFATRTAERQFPTFDEYGLLCGYTIPIRCTEELHSPKNESRDLEISRENIPDEIIYITYNSEQPIDYSI